MRHTDRSPHAERARRCPVCNLTSYPRLSPAIIIAVVRRDAHGERILLARNHRFPPGRYSVVAGFVEPGESLEACAQREVLEEVGLRIKNVRYFASQPWPFPNSLMIGFTAEYEDGEITLEESELADAEWFTADDLPQFAAQNDHRPEADRLVCGGVKILRDDGSRRISCYRINRRCTSRCGVSAATPKRLRRASS